MNFTCNQCNRCFSCNLALKDHINREHLKVFNYKCKLCDAAYVRKVSLEKHVINNHRANNQICKKEEEKLASNLHETQLQTSILENDRIASDVEKLKKKVAPVIVKFKISIPKHQRLRLQIQSLDAQPRNNMKIENEILSANIKNSTNSKNLIQCSVSIKIFSFKGVMRRHERIVHIIEKPHSCHKCNRSYTYKATLTQHVKKVHDKVKSFTAENKMIYMICSKSFLCQYYLTEHKKFVHQDTKPFHCDICSVAFKRKADMFKHKRKYHP